DFDNKPELKILLEKRAEKSNTCDLNEYALGLLAGYKAAQSKQYSLEDVKKAWEDGRNGTKLIGNFPYQQTKWINKNLEEFIQSLSTQQLPVSFEPEWQWKCPLTGVLPDIPDLSIGVCKEKIIKKKY